MDIIFDYIIDVLIDLCKNIKMKRKWMKYGFILILSVLFIGFLLFYGYLNIHL